MPVYARFLGKPSQFARYFSKIVYDPDDLDTQVSVCNALVWETWAASPAPQQGAIRSPGHRH
jgi:hypothetical protein